MGKEDHTERDPHSEQRVSHGEDEVENNDAKHYEKQDGENGELSVLERILPPLPAARNGIFVKVEAVLGLDVPFTAREKAVSARIFWGGQEVRSGEVLTCLKSCFFLSGGFLRETGDVATTSF